MCRIIQMVIPFGSIEEMAPNKESSNQQTGAAEQTPVEDFMSEEEFINCCLRCDLRDLCSAGECGAHNYPLDEPESINQIDEDLWWEKYGIQ